MSAVVFTREAPAFDESTNALTATTTTTIAGEAMQVRGRASRYQALGLVLNTMPTLFFTPTTYGYYANGEEFVQPGDTVEWAGETYTVKDVEPIAPDGIVIAARVVIAR